MFYASIVFSKPRNTASVLVFVVLLFTIFIPFSAPAQTTLFQDDFEDGNAIGWVLGDGWQVEDDGGNFVLSGSQHAFASTGDPQWRNYRFKADVKLISTASSTHLNFRNDGCTRYFIGFDANRIYLNKTSPCGVHTDLDAVTQSHEIGRWYTVEIAGNEGRIQVLVDGIAKIDYTDPEPLTSGPVSFETLTNAPVYFDLVSVSTDEPVSTTTWEHTGGPLGGLGYDVRIHPFDKQQMYVTDNFAGVAKSDDAGQNWHTTNSGIDIRSGLTGDAVNIFSLTIDPNTPDTIWSGTNGEGGQFGIFKSTDGGATWEKKVNGVSLGTDPVEMGLVFRGFTIKNGNSDVVYAQAEVQTTVYGREFNRVRGRVYKTQNGGDSWQLIWSGDNLARYVIIDPTNSNVLYLSTGIFDREAFNSDCANSVAGGAGVLKSSDGGQTWTSINNGLTDLYMGALRMHPANPQVLFAATGNNACSGGYEGNLVSNLFKTSDGGSTWTKALSANDIMTTVNFSPSQPDVVYAGSASAFYKSSDGGSTFSRLSNSNGIWGPDGVRAGVPIDVVVDPDNANVLYANNYGGGVFRSTDGAVTWQEWSKGYTGAELHRLHVPSGSSASVYVIGRSGPFASLNRGENWAGIATGDANFAEWYAIVAHPDDHQVLIIADEHQGVILKSTNGGSHFAEVFRHPQTNAQDPNKRQGFKALAFSASDPDIVYAGLAKDRLTIDTSFPIGTVLYKSVNGGSTFGPEFSIMDGQSVNQLVVNPKNANHVYAATTNGVYISTDGAASWTHVSSLGSRRIEALAVDFDHPGRMLAGEGISGSGIWISADDGATWSGPHNAGFSSPNPYITALVKDPSAANTFFASDLYSGVYVTHDNGLNWSVFPDWQMSGLTYRSVKDIAVNERFLYAATQGGGVFRFTREADQRRSIVAFIMNLLLGDE